MLFLSILVTYLKDKIFEGEVHAESIERWTSIYPRIYLDLSKDIYLDIVYPRIYYTIPILVCKVINVFYAYSFNNIELLIVSHLIS